MLSRFLALFLLCASFAAQSQYPTQTVRGVIGFPPGAGPLGGTPEALSAFLRPEQEKWGTIIRELGIKLQ